MMQGWPSLPAWGIPLTLQKRLVKFLVKRAVGRFLLREPDLEDLEVQLTEGRVQLRSLALNIQAINALFPSLPLEVTRGEIGEISLTIPWRSIWTGECLVQIHHILLTLEPSRHSPPPSPSSTTSTSSPTDDMDASSNPHSQGLDHSMMMMEASVDLADDFLRSSPLPPDEQDLLTASFYSAPSSPTLSSQIPPSIPNHPIKDSQVSGASFGREASWSGEPGTEGLQMLAGLIDSILARIRVVIEDIHVQIHVSTGPLSQEEEEKTKEEEEEDDGGKSIIDIHLSHISYVDSARSTTMEKKDVDPTGPGTFFGVPDELSKSILIGPIRITMGRASTYPAEPLDEIDSPTKERGRAGDPSPETTQSRSASVDSHQSATSLASVRTVLPVNTENSTMGHSISSLRPGIQENAYSGSTDQAPNSPILFFTTLGKGNWLRFRIRSRGAEPIDRMDGVGPREGKRAWEGEGRMEELFFILSPIHLRILFSLIQSMEGEVKISEKSRSSKYHGEEEDTGGWDEDFELTDPTHIPRQGRTRSRWGGRRGVGKWDDLIPDHHPSRKHREIEEDEGLDALVGQVAASVGTPSSSHPSFGPHVPLNTLPRTREPLVSSNAELGRKSRAPASFPRPSPDAHGERRGRLSVGIGKTRLFLLVHDPDPDQALALDGLGEEGDEGIVEEVLQDIHHLVARIPGIHLEWQQPGSVGRVRGEGGGAQMKVGDFLLEEWVAHDSSASYQPILWKSPAGDSSHPPRSTMAEEPKRDKEGFPLYEPWTHPQSLSPDPSTDPPILWVKYDVAQKMCQGGCLPLMASLDMEMVNRWSTALKSIPDLKSPPHPISTPRKLSATNRKSIQFQWTLPRCRIRLGSHYPKDVDDRQDGGGGPGWMVIDLRDIHARYGRSAGHDQEGDVWGLELGQFYVHHEDPAAPHSLGLVQAREILLEVKMASRKALSRSLRVGMGLEGGGGEAELLEQVELWPPNADIMTDVLLIMVTFYSPKIHLLPSYIICIHMENIIDQVQKHCPAQLNAYTQCVEDHPGDWETKCAEKRRLLRLCSEDNITVLRKVKEQCRKVAFDFDVCQAQEEDPTRCIEALKKLHTCAESVKAEEAIGKGGNLAGKDQK
ncbi:hypothetical protein BJ684DRAFT_20927 [Piptocephalis cylindrospora]|uniref:Autophagy-related protein 2 n=2 Tax=Piptocephalis cylindrospora TaxID=1907219 RepID=A0A4P9Y1A1_9FUNG|nr:hypothetical protein BJ684DRAFT_20927 [Piptocephalis cylindrospora]|eukprot:RKP12545.1 hypothetical protein BJ684DRAFT_20927 [Piptocephalis cylindrospora]